MSAKSRCAAHDMALQADEHPLGALGRMLAAEREDDMATWAAVADSRRFHQVHTHGGAFTGP